MDKNTHMNVLGKLLVSTLVLTSLSSAAFGQPPTDSDDDTLRRDNADEINKAEAVNTLRTYAGRVEAFLARSKSADRQVSTEAIDVATAVAGVRPPPGMDSGVQARTEPFTCSSANPEPCKIQALLHKFRNQNSQPIYYTNGKYKVSVYFENDNNYPTKYLTEDVFAGLSQGETEQLEQQLIEQLLGEGHAVYEPELYVSTPEHIGLTIYVTSPDELQSFVDDDAVSIIYHGGNSEVEELAGGGLMPPKSMDDDSPSEDTE